MSAHYLIIGNGAAGLSAAEVIRKRDTKGRVTIISNEPYLFYSRPGIAYVINGQVSPEQIIARSKVFYREHRLNLHFDTVTEIDPHAQHVRLKDGSQIAYDVMLLATGSRAVPPHFPGGDLQGVLTFDTLDDAKKVIGHCRGTRRAVVVGGGITAMELAEGMQRQGAQTHLLQRGARIWPRLFDQRESDIVARQIAHEGIALHFQEEVAEIIGRHGRVAGVRLQSGATIDCQVVGVAIGVRPNLQLVRDLPIAQDKGVLVNEAMQSSIPTLFAAGDVAQVYDRWTDAHHLDVLWPSAINEGRAAGYNMVDVAHGRQTPRYRYEKGSPFNAALLFGLHLTVIGRVGDSASRGEVDDAEEISHMSRGSSRVWTAPFSSHYRSAWDHNGADSLRIVAAGGRIVGALILGNQELADPLRQLIEHSVDLSDREAALLARDASRLPRLVLQAWRDWHEAWDKGRGNGQ